MMDAKELKIGVVSCSGEDCLGGTVSRLATRKMIDELRPDNTVTICLPLFLAGGQEERMFAKEFPTIAVDGCDKACARRATEKYSGKVSGAILVSDLIGGEVAEKAALSTRDLTSEHQSMVDNVAAEIVRQFDAILDASCQEQSKNTPSSCGCGCSYKC
ncbi:dgc [Lucifera butyrica]|uniref:Dgc n=2 Tax=Lucifera butyrica TaxID=1351585 RepID=A0A498R4S9_9FIRM|nr:dgc [Lucifera butyrica]